MIKRISLANRYRVAVLILALLATLNYIASEYKLNILDDHGYIINKSGKQRMISQKAMLLAHLYLKHRKKDDLRELNHILDEMQEVNIYLTSTKLTSELEKIYYTDGLKDDVEEFVVKLKRLANNPLKSTNFSYKKLKKLLFKLDEAVDIHEKSYDDDIEIIKIINIIIYLGVLAILLLLTYLIFIPTSRLIVSKTQEQENLLSLFNIGEVVLFRWNNDKNWSIDTVSQNSYKLLGYQKEEFMSQSITYDSIIVKEDLKQVRLEIDNAIANRKDFFTHKPYRIVTKDKEIKWVLNNTLIIRDKDQNITHFLGYISDVTELKAFEIKLEKEKERFRLASECSNDGLFDWNPKTDKIYFSDSWREIFGFKQDEKLPNYRDLSFLIHTDDIEKIFKDLEAHLRGETDMLDNISRIKHKSGRWIWVQTKGKALFNKYNKPYRLLGFQSDITLSKNYEVNLEKLVQKKTQEYKEQNRLIQQQSKLAQMGEMIGAIAHQWRQPLNSIGSNIQSLKYDFAEGHLNDEKYVLEFIDKNKTRINFMSKTIDDFRGFFKIDKDKAFFSVREKTMAIVDMFSSQPISKNITIEINDDEFMYYGFQNEYQQAIFNLLNNAIDALIGRSIREPKITILIDRKRFTVTIKDNAKGIDKDILNKIFDPYFTTKDQGKGTGIGLYMSKMIIESNMDATLSVTNDDNGAVFLINLSKGSTI